MVARTVTLSLTETKATNSPRKPEVEKKKVPAADDLESVRTVKNEATPIRTPVKNVYNRSSVRAK